MHLTPLMSQHCARMPLQLGLFQMTTARNCVLKRFKKWEIFFSKTSVNYWPTTPFTTLWAVQKNDDYVYCMLMNCFIGKSCIATTAFSVKTLTSRQLNSCTGYRLPNSVPVSVMCSFFFFLKGKIPHVLPVLGSNLCCTVGWVPPAFVGISLVEVRPVGIWVTAVKTEH